MTDYADLEKRLRACASLPSGSPIAPRYLVEAADALASLTRELEEAKDDHELLAAIQWNGRNASGEFACPFCFALKAEGHHAECDLGNRLSRVASEGENDGR